MNSGELNLFIKMIREDYKLSEQELEILGRRLIADDKEFERVLRLYKNKGPGMRKGVEPFRPILQDLLS